MFYQGYYYYPYYCYYPYYRSNSYPPVDIDIFQQSIQEFQQLMEDGSLVLNNLRESPDKMEQLMEAAQAGQDEKVNEVIMSTGVETVVDTSYTPTSVTFTLRTDENVGPRCCTLTMNLVWGF
ncbi:hypothetical protein LGQ02_04010 [Bacillus shivajii]|uniref:hypothetical protein n=1 Tax=Bacillus shivajii TaxID=1983719 RepID=UPI001CFAD86C|nr:hypothetical protein [Bacillus shivajii]UCZ53957.1 hypothetical protein LGQ02_04010 [Bacillus shivajii]